MKIELSEKKTENCRLTEMLTENLPTPESIIKLGGSLLGLPDLRSRLTNFIGDFSRSCSILICGGGGMVDQVRKWDHIYNLGEARSHWLALRTLSITARVVEKAVPGLELADSVESIEPLWKAGKLPVFDPYQFITELDEGSIDSLPRRWRVTSDSIAARMARVFRARELILLKSTTFPERMSMTEAAELGMVDEYFPTAARDVQRVVAVNLRADNLEESILYSLRHRAQAVAYSLEFGRGLDELFTEFLHLFLQFRRRVLLDHLFPERLGIKTNRPALDQVHHPIKFFFPADRHLGGNDIGTELAADGLDHPEKIRSYPVKLVHKHEPGYIVGVSLSPDCFRLGLDSGCPAKYPHHPIQDP